MIITTVALVPTVTNVLIVPRILTLVYFQGYYIGHLLVAHEDMYVPGEECY